MIRINGVCVDGATARYADRVLTLTLRNTGLTLSRIVQLLSDEPSIEVIKNGAVTAIYRSVALHALTMETAGGAPAVTASLTAASVFGGGQAERIEQAFDLAEQAMDAVKAIEEGMSDV